MSKTVRDMIGTVSDFIRVCPDGGFHEDTRPIGGGYNSTDVWYMLWFIDTFVTDRAQKLRFMNTIRAVDDFSRDLAKLHRHETGEPMRVPVEMLEELKRRMILGYFPNLDEIVNEARDGQPLRAQKALMRTIERDQWRRRS